NKKRANLPDNVSVLTQAQGLKYLLQYLPPSRTKSGLNQHFAGVQESHFSVPRARFPGERATAARAMVSRREVDHLAYFAHIRSVEPHARCGRVGMYSITSEN